MAITEISALISGIKATIDIAKGLKSAHDSHTIVQAQSDILEQLTNLRMDALTLQDKTSALIQERDELQKKLIEFEKWQKTESKYHLEQVERGKFVYSPNDAKSPEQPSHWLCTNCWSNREKSILQASFHDEYEAYYSCPRCKTEIHFRFKQRPPDDPIVHVRRPWDDF